MATTTSASRASALPGSSSEAPPSVTEQVNSNSQAGSRKSSLGFLRRSKSTEPLTERKASSARASRKMKEQLAREEEAARLRVPRQPPRLPSLAPTPQLTTFGGEEVTDNAAAPSKMSSSPKPAPSSVPVGSSMLTESVDPYARTESMTHRGRFSYASSAVSSINNPRRLRRRKDPTPYK